MKTKILVVIIVLFNSGLITKAEKNNALQIRFVHGLDTITYNLGLDSSVISKNISVKQLNLAPECNDGAVFFYIKTKHRIYQVRFNLFKQRTSYVVTLKDSRSKHSYFCDIKANDIGVSYEEVCFNEKTKHYKFVRSTYFRSASQP